MRNYTKDQVLAAIKGSNGLVSTIAALLKCDWNTATRYINKWEETKTALQNEREFTLDVAESVVFGALKTKDVQTAKWYLKMKGQSRGYIETQETTIKNSEPLNINFSGGDMTAEEIAAQDNVEIGGGLDD